MAERDLLLRRGCVCVLVCLLVTDLAGSPSPARAAPAAGHTYVVNSTLDEPETDASTGNCSSTPSGKCTLRAAIMLSNFATGPNTIILPAGTYVLTRPGYDNNALVGDLDIGHDVTLQGAGSGATIVDGNGAVTGDRAFQILDTTQNVTFSGLTIRNGQSLSSTVGVIGGGGLYMEGAGHLSLSDVIIEGNTGLFGGGVYANFSSQGGSMEMDHVIVRANTATDAGGGFDIVGTIFSHWSIERSEIYSNTADYGGGIWSSLDLALFDSRLHDNHATFDGGAIWAFQPFGISRTTLDANTAGRFGGAIYHSSPVSGFFSIVESTLSGNSAQYGGGFYFSGNSIPSARLTLINSTLSGNVVFRPRGATGSAYGGGLYVDGGQTELFNTTIASNRVQLGYPIYYFGIGGGVFLTHTAVLTAENSLIANNSSSNGHSLGTPDDCFSSGTTGTLAYDLILTTTNCFVSGPKTGNIVGLNPLLGPLQNNGGSTQTRALLANSPAIGAGAPGGCTGADGSQLTTDQRGAPRPASGCDIGAYTLVPEADLSVGQHVSSDPVRVGAPLTYTVTVTNNGPITATGVVLTDTLPAIVTMGAVASPQGNCTGPAPVTCNLGLLASGAHITVTVAVTPTAAGVITNTVAVTANEFDPVLANNSASETTAVVRELYLPLVTRGP